MDAAEKRRPSVNLGFLAPLTPFRHWVMGEESMERAATPDETKKIAGLISETRSTRPIPRYPAIYRDITIIVDRGVETQSVLDKVEAFQEQLVENLQLFDVFEGDPIAAGKKSVSFRVTYRSPDKTLVDEDVNDLHKSITERLLNAFDATLP